MKSQFLLFTVCLFALAGFSQSATKPNVPAMAKIDLAGRFANGAAFKWYQEGDEFEAEGVENGVSVAVAYSSAGIWTETEREMDKSKLPASFSSGFQKSYPSGEIVGVESVERPNKPLAYEVKFYVGKEFSERIFNVQGVAEAGNGGDGSDGSGQEGSDDDED